MTRTSFRTLLMAAIVGLAALSLPATAEAGHGGWGGGWHGGGGHWGGHGYYGGGGYWGPGWGWGGAGLAGLAVGTAIGAALAPPPVIVAPNYAAGPVGYAPGAYGPPAWSPEWYTYCKQQYRSFNARTGYFTGFDGLPHFCQ